MKKYILVTGASSGIGKQTVVELAKKSTDYVIFAAIRKREDKALIEHVSKNIIGVYLDITNKASILKALKFITSKTKVLDVIVNSAGSATAGPIELLNINDIKNQFEVNTFGPLFLFQTFLPILNKNGKIININSMAQTGIFPFIAPYCASKRALSIFLNALNIELKNDKNIKIIEINPGVVQTPIWQKSVKACFENLRKTNNKTLLNSYHNELNVLKNNAQKNETKGLFAIDIANLIIKIIKNKNPKSRYNIGLDSHFAFLISKILPYEFLNRLIKFKLKTLK
ncbi:MAG: SDR family NAD(P)-dependent oxidoreductase [Candidatus Gastranaerophilales bacterium]|nr:SDR family NAD(P)-dependent oxidoreductase [Candidatus Gastranaerophilales bacterium]